MREISCENIIATVERLCIKAANVLPPALAILLECASEAEAEGPGLSALCDIVDNFKYAAENKIPICQDTGMAMVFADIGQDVHITGGLFEDAVNEGVRRGYENGFLRKSIVRDPLRRVNTDDNTPAVLYTRIVAGDRISIQVAPKGFGSENMCALKMFLPTSTAEEIEDFVVQAVATAGSNPCPPIFVGVGIGGTADMAMLQSKRALVREADIRNGDEYYADMERRLLNKINALGIGPQGFGGHFTAVAVNIEAYPTHIAGLPCAISIGCHATRHAEAVL